MTSRVSAAPVFALVPVAHDNRVHPVGFAVQRALMSYSGSADAPDLARLRERVNAAWSTWQESPYRYTEISEVLPDLIIDAQAAQRGLAHGSPDERREGQRIRADSSFLLRTFTRSRTCSGIPARKTWMRSE